MLARPSHYEMLGIAEDADKSEVIKAYRKWSLVLHPDKQPLLNSWLNSLEPELVGTLPAAWLRVSDAYQTLIDSTQRTQYDSNRRNVTITETAEKKIINDDFSIQWDKFKKQYEIYLAYAEVLKDPTDYLTQSLKKEKELKTEVAALTASKTYLEVQYKYLQGELIECKADFKAYIILAKEKESNLTKELTAATKKERQAREALAEKLTQAPQPSSSASSTANRPSMFDSHKVQVPTSKRTEQTESTPQTPFMMPKIKPKGLLGIRENYHSFMAPQKPVFAGISVVFDSYNDAMYFYAALSADPSAFTITFPQNIKGLGCVTMNTSHFMSLNLSENNRLTFLLEKLGKSFDISGVWHVEWDEANGTPLEREKEFSPSNTNPFGMGKK